MLTPARQRLIDRISELAEVERTRQQLSDADMPSLRATAAADAAVEAAKKGVGAAASGAVDHRIAALAGVDDGPAPSVENARRRLREAEDEAAAASEARHEVRRRLGEANERLPWRRHLVLEAAKGVCWAEAKPVLAATIAAYRETHTRLLELSRLLRFFHSIAPGIAEDAAAHELYILALTLPADAQATPTVEEAAWRAALQALQADANARLPR